MSPYSLSLYSWCTHHDINNLSVSMLRQFSIFQVILKGGRSTRGRGRGGGGVNAIHTWYMSFLVLQNQVITALTAISEKVDKLSDEVHEMRQQLNHLTPKY